MISHVRQRCGKYQHGIRNSFTPLDHTVRVRAASGAIQHTTQIVATAPWLALESAKITLPENIRATQRQRLGLRGIRLAP